MSKKLFYNAPVAEPLVVQAEGVVCTSGLPQLGNPGLPGANEDIIDVPLIF